MELRDIPPILKSAIMTSAMVMIIIALLQLCVWILAIERIPGLTGAFVTGLNLPAVVILL